MSTVVVTASLDGARADVAVAALTGLSRSAAARRLDAGGVHGGGRVLRRRDRVHTGLELTITDTGEATARPAPPLPPVRWRDEHLLVLAKPAGMVVHPGHGHPDGTLVDALAAAGVPLAPGSAADRPGIVHRLDRGTSGLLIVASTAEAAAGLTQALAEHRIERRYLALVVGVPSEPRGRLEGPIGRDPRERTRFAVVGDGRPATTRYRTLATGRAGQEPVALLACRLETGRTHQIRVHLTAHGHPLVGDEVYGPRPTIAAQLGLERIFLHAQRLAFRHPVTGARVVVAEPLPADLRSALRRAGAELPGEAG